MCRLILPKQTDSVLLSRLRPTSHAMLMVWGHMMMCGLLLFHTCTAELQMGHAYNTNPRNCKRVSRSNWTSESGGKRGQSADGLQHLVRDWFWHNCYLERLWDLDYILRHCNVDC